MSGEVSFFSEGPPSLEEFESARKRIRARNWLRRARMVHMHGLLCDREEELLAGDTPEQARRDEAVYERWLETRGFELF